MKALEIAKAIDVKVMLKGEKHLRGCNGLYFPDKDEIVLRNSITEYSVEFVLLHELIHATGHVNRLGRVSVVLMGLGIGTSQLEIDTEESVAQFGAYYLGLVLELDKENLLENLNGYSSCFNNLTPETMEYIKREAWNAAKWLCERTYGVGSFVDLEQKAA